MKKKLVFILFLISLFIPSSSVFASNIEEATKYYNEAIDLYKEDNVNESIELFKKAIELNPNFYEAHYNLSQILMSIDKNEEALKSLEKIIQLQPNDSETLYSLGKIQYKRGYLSNSLSYLNKIPSTAPQFESAKILIAKIEKRQGELALENKIKEHKVLKDEKGLAKGIELVNISAPSGIAKDSRGNIYVASFSENAIYKITQYGQKSLYSKSSLIKGPIGIAIDKNDNLYIANYVANNVIKISSDAQASIFADVSKPYCITYDSAQDRLYITEQNSNKLFKFDL